MRLIRSVLCGCLLCAAPIPDAFAQPAASPPAASSAMTAKARELHSEGIELLRQKKWPQAEASFEAAWALAKHYSIAANLGEARLRLAKYRAAAELLAFAYRQAPATETPERKHIAGLLAEAKGKVGTLSLHVEPADAAVTVGDRMIAAGTLSEPVFVEPGSVTVTARKDGYATATTTIDAAPGAPLSVDLSLSPVVTVAPTPTPTPTAAPTSTALPVVVPRSTLPAYVMGGVGVASLIAGDVLMGLYEGAKADMRDRMPRDKAGNPLCRRPPVTTADRPECAALRTKNDEATTFGNSGIALFAVGGIAVAGAAAYFFWPQPPSAPTKPASTLAPMVGADGAGVLWTGSF